MPPTAKDLDVASSNAQTPGGASGAKGAPPADAGKPQPVALEVPVTVNGARTVEGSDKREPFSETTQTVLVFGNGAVIRLASNVTAGQLLFLTNEKTKKEVVCQVVKSKNYRNVSGYVELEFTETVSGFWGMRFPGERPAAQPTAPAPVAKSPVVLAVSAPRVEAPAASSLPKRPESQPAAAPAPPPPARTESVVTTSTLKTPPLNLLRATQPPATQPPAAQPKTPALPSSFGTSTTSSSRPPEVKPPAPVATKVPTPPAAAVHAQASTDALKRESARLQEQLSSMLFTPEVPAKPAQPASPTPATNKPANADPISKIIEMAKPQAPFAKATPTEKSVSPALGSALDADEVKIPSWLEPLARNAGKPAQNDLSRDEVALPEEIEFEVQDVSAPTTTQETAIFAPAEPALESALPAEFGGSDRAATKSHKTIMIGAIAAGLLVVAAGGTWYLRQSSSPAQQTAAAASIPPVTSSAPAVQPLAKNAEGPAAGNATNANSKSASSPAAPPPQVSSSPVSGQAAAPTAQPLKSAPLEKAAAAELSAYKKLAEPQPQPALQQSQPRKASLGEVHFAAPTITRRAATPESGAADLAPALNGGQVSANDALGGGLVAGNAKQPAAPSAPLPVGGDVKQAHLISSVPPTYPTIAKTQHVQGEVRIDALVDATGKVSSMKVVSGPVLLHQAAMDALRQWKYQPAMLDGKPVPMHLTVTVQFRLQ
jgi:protein TonB